MNSTLSAYVLVLLRWWRIVVAVPLLLVTAAALYFIAGPIEYQSKALLFVATPRDDERSYYAGDDYSKKRDDTYLALTKSPEIAQRVIDDLGLDIGPRELTRRTKLTPVLNTVLLQLTTTGDTPEQAQAIGNAYVMELRRSINALESVSGGLAPRVELIPVQPPSFEGRAGLFHPWMILGAVAALGLIAGALIAVVVALLDGRIRRAEDAVEATGTPVLAKFRSSVEWEESQFQPWNSESGRQLRSTLDRLAILGSKVIMVASAERGSGKTGVALAAARALADRGSTVALVDFDSRGSRLASGLGLDNPETVGDLVHGNTLYYDPSPSVQTLPQTNWHGVSVIPFGSLEVDQGSTVDHPGTATMFSALRSVHEWVIIDTPAAIEFSDASRLARHADAVVLIVKAGRTAFDELRDVCNQLTHAGGHVLGVVFVDDTALGARRGFRDRGSRPINDLGDLPVS